MKNRLARLLPLLLAACGGTAPPVRSPDAALNQPQPCADINAPPPGYRGPVSPHSLGCADTTIRPVAPAGIHDYATGQPPRQVRGN
ncbi:MAG: hypothetical protein LDL39_10265 [Magnetospirillum sp.]|nr:hypothetical protein [Magnetospirillum sp.]